MSEKAAKVTKLQRWLFLLCVSMVIGTNYYAYDALSSIKTTLQSELSLTSTDYGFIVAFYSFPNTFLLMAVIGGVVLDRIGIRKTGFFFTLVCALGVILTAYGASDFFRNGGPGYALLGSFWSDYSPEMKMMVLGRLLFGLGAETSIVVVNKVVAKWFKGRELAFAFAINLAIARIGTAAALISSPILVKTDFGWTTAVWVAAMLMSIGFLFFLVYIFFDRKFDPVKDTGGVLAEDEEFHLTDITDLLKNKGFVYISLLCVTFYSAIFPFQSYAPDFLYNKFGVSEEASGRLTSIIIFGTIFFTPLFGWFVDHKGKRASLMLYGSAMLVGCHTLLALTPLTPYISMFVLGIAFSLVPASMWPSVALVVKEKRLGTAYGLMTSLQNLGLFAFPILAGWITDVVNPGVTADMVKSREASLDYTYTILMFAVLGLFGLIFAVLLKRAAGDKLEPADV